MLKEILQFDLLRLLLGSGLFAIISMVAWLFKGNFNLSERSKAALQTTDLVSSIITLILWGLFVVQGYTYDPKFLSHISSLFSNP